MEPGQLAWLDRGLRTLSGTGLDPAQKLSIILLIVNYVRGEAQISAVMLQARKRSDVDNRAMQGWYGRTLAKLVDAERFPALAELIAAGTFDSSGKDVKGSADFDFGLARVLDGIEMLVRAR